MRYLDCANLFSSIIILSADEITLPLRVRWLNVAGVWFLIIAMLSVHSLLSPLAFPLSSPSLPSLKVSLVATVLRIPQALYPSFWSVSLR